MPVSRAICSKVWNCGEQGLTVCARLFCWRWADFSDYTHRFAQFFCWYKNTNELTSCLFWRTTLFLTGCHQAELCCSLFFVTWSCYWCHLQHARLFVVHLSALVSPGLHHGFIQTAMILCAVSHWWVMMLQFWENWFWLNLEWLISLQLQGNYINTKHLWTEILYSRNGLFKLHFLSPSLFYEEAAASSVV